MGVKKEDETATEGGHLLEPIGRKLTRVDVAIDIFGLPLAEAFPNPKSKRYEWSFPFHYSEHQTKSKNEEMIFTGYTIRRQRWSLTVYDKQVEIKDGNPHPIKQSYFETLSEEGEAITRIELRVKSAEALVAAKGPYRPSVRKWTSVGPFLSSGATITV